MDEALRKQMRALVAENSGDARQNARTTLDVAAQQMAKDAATLKTTSKSLAAAMSQLPTMLKAAHELTMGELKALKKLLDRLELTKSKLKKYILWADENVKDAQKLVMLLAQPGPSTRIGPEPDPEKPFRR
jgi:hypothetical protein